MSLREVFDTDRPTIIVRAARALALSGWLWFHSCALPVDIRHDLVPGSSSSPAESGSSRMERQQLQDMLVQAAIEGQEVGA